jgi:LysR family transcriptional activator of mexEF-oprN operon
MTFRVGLSDDVEFGLLPPFLRAMREEAPNIVVVVQHVDYWRIPDLLASGDITVGISQTRGLPANAKRKLLRRMHARVLRADASDKPLTLDEYCARPHVLVSHTANTSGIADEWLEEIGRKRRVVLSVPQFSSLPALLAGTDLLAGLPDYAAKAMAKWGNLFDEPVPFDTPPLDLSMVWLSVMDTDPAERWLRSRLEMYMGDRAGLAL